MFCFLLSFSLGVGCHWQFCSLSESWAGFMQEEKKTLMKQQQKTTNNGIHGLVINIVITRVLRHSGWYKDVSFTQLKKETALILLDSVIWTSVTHSLLSTHLNELTVTGMTENKELLTFYWIKWKRYIFYFFSLIQEFEIGAEGGSTLLFFSSGEYCLLGAIKPCKASSKPLREGPFMCCCFFQKSIIRNNSFNFL